MEGNACKDLISFLDFFKDKIARLSSSLTPNPTSSPHLPPSSSPPSFNTFSPTSHDEVRRAILMSSNATCSLDTIPTFLLKSCLDSLITPITNIINLSFLEGSFPTSFKDALVYPLLKKHNLPHEDLSSYRPISNLNFLSKILERIILFRMNAHFHTFPSLCPLQSAYRKFHSTETALLRIYNDLLLASDRRQVTALVLLDLSSAFDTIDHQILLDRLASFYGFSGLALLYFDLIFLIALIMLLFNLPPLLPSTLLLVSLRVLFLVLSFSLSTLLLLAISLKTLISLFTYMPMILNFTSRFQVLILL